MGSLEGDIERVLYKILHARLQTAEATFLVQATFLISLVVSSQTTITKKRGQKNGSFKHT